MRKWGLIACLLGAGMFPSGADGQETGARVNSCLICHSDVKMSAAASLWRKSVHRPAGIFCQHCHGGSATATDKEAAHDPDRGYIGVPAPEAVPALCGTCHKQQFAHYMASPHGIAGAFVPNCSECHGAHGIRPPRVGKIATASKCGDCHGDDTLAQFIGVIDRVLVPLGDARQAVARLQPDGVPTDPIRAQIDGVQNAYFTRITHRFVFDVITPRADSLAVRIRKMEKDLRAARAEVDTRRRYGHAAAIFLVVLAGVLWLYRRTLPDE